MKKIILLILLGIACTASLHAQKKTFTRDYTYQASEVDSKVTAKNFATYEMEKTLLREIGEYLKAERSVIQGNSQSYFEKIEAITAGIVEMKVLNEQWNGVTYYIKAEMTVDPKDLERRIADVLNDKQKTRELEDERTRRKTAETELLKLRRELERTKNQSLQTAYQAKANELTARVKGDKAYGNQFYALAAENYEEAAKKNQGDANMYLKMGIAYYQQQKYHDAIKSLNKATELNSNLAEAYYYMGIAYLDEYSPMDHRFCGNCLDNALLAFQKALTIRPNYVEAHVGIGAAYLEKDSRNLYPQAIDACKKAISINPHYAEAYYYMYEALCIATDYEQARTCLSRACQLGSLKAQVKWNQMYKSIWGSWLINKNKYL